MTLWLAVIYQIRREEHEALHEAQVNLANLNRAFAEHSAKTIQGADQVARFLRAEYQENQEKGAQFDVASFLNRQGMVETDYQLLSIIDAQGWVAYSSQPFQRVDLRDREHFRVHAEGREDRLFISKPVLGRVSGKWSIQVTRPIRGHHAQALDGVVVVSLSPDHFTRFYRDVDLGRYGVMAMVGMDGVVRARAPQPPSQQGEAQVWPDVSSSPILRAAMAQPRGTMRAASTLDGVDRVWAFQRLSEHHMVVLTGMAITDIEAESRERAAVYVAVAAGVSVVVLGFLLSLIRSTRRQENMVAQLRQSQQQAQIANEMKTRLLASVSHELRTPLNGILGYAELIRDGASAQETQEFSSIIFHSAQHLEGLVSGLLDLARIQSGRMVLRIEEVDLLSWVRQIYSAHMLQASENGIHFALHLPPDAQTTDWRVRTDRIRVTQILTNALSNAFKFTPQGDITLSMYRQDDRCVVLRVQDSGIGMAQQRLSQVFTRFHVMTRDPHEPVHPKEGAGLGLPLAKELAGLLHSELDIESRLGHGTLVTLRLTDMRSADQDDDHNPVTTTSTLTGSA